MSEVLLLTSDGCSLCEHGRAVLSELAEQGLLSWREVDAESDEGCGLAAVAPPLRPVLFGPDGIWGYGRLSQKRVRRRCASVVATERTRVFPDAGGPATADDWHLDTRRT
jgi:hypothetical protein